MPKPKKDTVFYDLSASQDVAYIQFKYCFFKEIMNVAVCLYINGQMDYNLLIKALNLEIKRNDCLRLFYRKAGGGLKQYFTDPYEVEKIDEFDFSEKTKAEQDSFLLKDASKPLKFLKDEIFRIKFIKTYDGKTAIYFAVCHLNMDAVSVFLFFSDLLKIYTALRDNTEMPKSFAPFTEYMEREKLYLKNTEKISKDEQFFRDLFEKGGEPLYLGAKGIEALEKLRRKRRNPDLRSFPIMNPLQDKTKNIKLHIDEELSELIDRYCSENKIMPLYIIQLAMRTYLSKINGGAEDAIYITNCNKRATLADKNTSGSLADGVMIRTILGPDTTFRDGVSKSGEALSQSFRHANYGIIKSAALLHGMYHTRLLDSYIMAVFSYIPVEAPDGWHIDAEWISNGRFASQLYIIVVRNPNKNAYELYYEYRVKVLNEENIRALHGGMTEIIKLGLENPEISLGDIMKQTNI